MKQNIIIKDKEISFLIINGVEYFNLTEIGSLDEELRDDLVRSWMRNRLTLESLIVWEQMFNPNFKGDALDTFRKEAGLNTFNLPAKNQGIVYASEADLLNKVVFDKTASEWKAQNPEQKGNIRDHASNIKLTILANLESHNAELIRQGLNQEERLEILEKINTEQLEVLYEKRLNEVFKKKKI